MVRVLGLNVLALFITVFGKCHQVRVLYLMNLSNYSDEPSNLASHLCQLLWLTDDQAAHVLFNDALGH